MSADKEELIKRAGDLRKNATPWENKLWYEFLSSYKPRFRRQRPIGNFIIDFYCVKAKLAVELDGSGHFEEDKSVKDKKRTAFLNRQGITVIRFSNYDVDKNFYEVCSVIDSTVKEIMKKSE